MNLSFGFNSLGLKDLFAILQTFSLKYSAFGYVCRKKFSNLIENLS